MVKQMLEDISKVAETTGIAVKAESGKVTPDDLIAVLDKIEIRFDDDGTPHLPTIVLRHSGMRTRRHRG